VRKMTQIANKENILTKRNERRHEIRVDRDNDDVIMEVWIRDINFFDVQNAAQSMFTIQGDGSASLNLEGYWRYAFSNWVVRSNPSLTPDEMLELNAYAGEQLANILPKPDQLAEMMQGGFTNANN
jgi:hypothetical protein